MQLCCGRVYRISSWNKSGIMFTYLRYVSGKLRQSLKPTSIFNPSVQYGRNLQTKLVVL